MKKVAYNNKHGGFGVSHAVLNRMIELGHEGALLKKQAMDDNIVKHNYRQDTVYLEDPPPLIKRHDPILIQAIEELGLEANGRCASIRIQEMNDSDHYQISEFDGLEKLKILNLYCDCC
jgi:hypothetical protein